MPLSVQYVGGSLAAPGWGDIIDWLARTQAKASDGSATAAAGEPASWPA